MQRREPGFGPDPRELQLELNAREDVRRHAATRRKLLSLPVLAVLVILLGGVTYAVLGRVGQTHVTEGGIPIILADQTPVRIRPEQPGGMEIPFQDTTVYDELASGKKQAAGTTEHLLASPEQPLPKPEAPATKPDPTADAVPQVPATGTPGPFPALENEAVLAPQPSQAVPPPVSATPSPKLLLPPPPATAIKHAVAKPAMADGVAEDDTDDQPAPKTSRQARPVATTSSHSEIQLGAYRDASVAETQWQKLLASHGDELGSLSHHVERADLGDKGVWYRLKAGPLDDAHARQDCAVLKSDGVTCFVPGK
jgi:hypothetical protein